MAQEQRLLTLENTSDEAIHDAWDGVTYTFPPGTKLTMAYGLGVHFRERHPELEMKGETYGLAPEAVVVEVKLVNPSEHPLTVFWDGRPYLFEPGVPTGVEASLATSLVVQARTIITEDFPKGGKLEVVQDAVAVVPESAQGPTDTVTVSTLAKELGIKVKELLPTINDLGIEAKNGKSALNAEQAVQVRQAVNPTPEPTEPEA